MGLEFSIVIPNYNSGPLLERAILSLLGQEHADLQIILMDSASTDESSLAIEKYRDRIDTVVVEKDKGQVDALNKGFELARGNVFGWLCADDELLPGTLSHVAGLLERHPKAGIVTGSCQRIFTDGTSHIVPVNPDPWSKVRIQNVIEQPSTFWRGDLHRMTGKVDDRYQLAFDWDLWNRMRKGGATILPTERVLSRYYFSATNKSGNSGRVHAVESFDIVRRYGPMYGGLAYIFRFLYFQFDLKGCYDNPPSCGLLRSHLFIWTLALLRAAIGKRMLYLYNWHFASCQERGLKWW